MALNTSRDCKLRNRSYPDGSDVGQRGALLHCINGKWEAVVLAGGI